MFRDAPDKKKKKGAIRNHTGQLRPDMYALSISGPLSLGSLEGEMLPAVIKSLKVICPLELKWGSNSGWLCLTFLSWHHWVRAGCGSTIPAHYAHLGRTGNHVTMKRNGYGSFCLFISTYVPLNSN